MTIWTSQHLINSILNDRQGSSVITENTWLYFATIGTNPQTWADMETGGTYERTWGDLES